MKICAQQSLEFAASCHMPESGTKHSMTHMINVYLDYLEKSDRESNRKEYDRWMGLIREGYVNRAPDVNPAQYSTDKGSTQEFSTENNGNDLAESNGREILGGGVETYSYGRLEDIETINVWTCNDGTHDGTHDDNHDGTWSQYPHKVESQTNPSRIQTNPSNITSKPKGIDPYKPNTGGDMFDEKG